MSIRDINQLEDAKKRRMGRRRETIVRTENVQLGEV